MQIIFCTVCYRPVLASEPVSRCTAQLYTWKPIKPALYRQTHMQTHICLCVRVYSACITFVIETYLNHDVCTCISLKTSRNIKFHSCNCLDILRNIDKTY